MQPGMSQRLRAYETLPIPWHFQALPPDHAARQTAVFVVHGIGTQAYSDTAMELRSGLEDALHKIFYKNPKQAVPPPFIFEGYWANYASIEKTFPLEWAAFTDEEKGFFTKLWQRRSLGTFSTARWFVQQNFRLFSRKTIQDFGRPTGIMIMGMAPLTILSAIAMSVTSPRFLADVLSDIRIYCEPKGDIEKAIVQRIDRRVGERFLRLLGLDWDFKDLPPDQVLNVSGKPQIFQYVTWVSHSLGTIISYNVVGDLLQRVEEKSAEIKALSAQGQEDTHGREEDFQLRRNIDKVKRGLHRFFTLGSPLHSIALLFPNALRPWPASARQMLLGSKSTQKWWVNFYHAWDPVSERLLVKRFDLAINLHSQKLWRIPGKAHSDYFKDKDVLKYIISRAYGTELCKWPDPPFLKEKTYLWARRALVIIMLILAIAVFALAIWWVAFGGGALWLLKRAIQWAKNLIPTPPTQQPPPPAPPAAGAAQG